MTFQYVTKGLGPSGSGARQVRTLPGCDPTSCTSVSAGRSPITGTAVRTSWVYTEMVNAQIWSFAAG